MTAQAPINALLLEQSKHAATYTRVLDMVAQHHEDGPAPGASAESKLAYEEKSAELFQQLVEADKRSQQADLLVRNFTTKHQRDAGDLIDGARQRTPSEPQPQQPSQANKWTRQPAEKDRPTLRRTPTTTPADCERFLTQFQLHCSTEPFPFEENGAITHTWRSV